MIKKIILFIVMISLCITIAVGAAMHWMATFIKTPAAKISIPVTFTVSSGQHLTTIAQNLKSQDLVSNPTAFKLYVRIKKAATRIKAGEYEMNTGMSPETIMRILISGKSKLYRLTIPEGMNMQEIAILAQEAGLCSRKQFLSLCNDLDFINQCDVPGMTLEGYLFPETYFFSKETDCKTLIKKMISTFKKTFNRTWKTRAKEIGLSVHEVVILASIIEKETGNGKERPIISSVFHNRLKRHMRLESDPTVIYGVSDYDGRIRYKHLRRVTPYNTYKIDGLPVGPIANPGAQALKAALYPAQTNYLFFVSKNDTTHKFSTNLKDHNRAVKKYQLNQ
ncbi:endolytic transglycosylase MltG [Desulfobacter latus]|uniref:Endolytic murein transglycosylase n=1 Tax=Desulfobacter latus TaxID=2292 RepID=A0A850TAF2_9BACT|nr:endolytic transglycosylase MltG [Desulfobacter latus]NWH04356.1 endolytic transglycosylase MltG [Desulfobacter latus]